MAYDFLGRVAVVTGGSSGIGAAAADALAERGIVVIVARKPEKLEAYARKLNDKHGSRVYTFPIDVAENGAAEKLVNYVRNEIGEIGLVVNAAGNPVKDSAPNEAIESAYNTHVVAKRRLNEAAIMYMIQNGGGRIINVSSHAALEIFPDQRNYHEQMKQVMEDTREINRIYRSRGIIAHAIGPGFVNTEGVRRGYNDIVAEARFPHLRGKELEESLGRFWNDPRYVIQPSEMGEWFMDIIENPEAHPEFDVMVRERI